MGILAHQANRKVWINEINLIKAVGIAVGKNAHPTTTIVVVYHIFRQPEKFIPYLPSPGPETPVLEFPIPP